MRLIGLLLIRDEQDMLDEALRNHTLFCDMILVLDGTEGAGQVQSEAICRSFRQVREYWRDAETGYELPLRDGARQFLLDRARAMFGQPNWYVVLHGDELWGRDPRPLLAHEPKECAGISVDLYHFFPHVSERATWNFGAGSTSIEALSRWYMMPPIVEQRLFADTGSSDYAVDQHSRTIPDGIGVRHENLAVKQYNYRTPMQAHQRALQRRDAQWQENHYQHLIPGPDNFFVETLARKEGRWAAMIPAGEGIATNIEENPLPSLRRRPDAQL